MIEMKDISFTYAGATRKTLNNINLSIKKNDITLLLGASGSGKSSLVHCLNGLIPYHIQGELSGTIKIADRKIHTMSIGELTKQVGLVFQDPEAQLVTMKVEDEIAFGLENLCLPPKEITEGIQLALKQTGLEGYQQQLNDQLSGGQKQRLALASVLCMQPQILILDEPTAYLDPEGTNEFFSTLRKLQQTTNLTIIIIEHKLDKLIDIVNHVIVLGKNGRIIADGTPQNVFYEHYEQLISEGVWLPDCVRIINELKRKGFAINRTPITVTETAKVLTALLPAKLTTEKNMIHRENNNEQCILLSDAKIALEIKNRHFSCKHFCPLKPMELKIPQGDFLAVVGKNGAGKSTLAQYIVKLLPLQKDVIFLDGCELVQLPVHDVSQKVGYVFQNPEHQFVTSRVIDELAFGLKRLKLTQSEIDARVHTMLEQFALIDYAEMNPFCLSHGEKRRLSVASMLITGQKLLIFDEPTFGQDLQNANKLMRIMKDLQKAGNTVIMISHDMNLIAEYADHVAVLDKGFLRFHGPVEALFSKPALLEEAGLALPPIVEIMLQTTAIQPKYGEGSLTEKLLTKFEQYYGAVT